MAQESDLKAIYAGMDLGKLMELNGKLSTLTPMAQRAFRAELSARGISEEGIREWESQPNLWDLTNSGLPIATRVNGTGTTIFHGSEELPDGSYWVTKWITILFVPVWRVSKIRVKRTTLSNGKSGYVVIEQRK